MALPYSSHPIYNLRKIAIIIALIGIVLCLLSYNPYSNGAPAENGISLAITALFCTADLILYATNKLEKPDEDPKWPTLKWMVGDAILALILQLMFWAAMNGLSYGYQTNIIGAYGALAAFLCSILHAWCLWKQLMARYRQKWLLELARSPCAQCGYTEPPLEQTTRDEARSPIHPSPELTRRVSTMTPESVASTMEEGLLIGSDYNGYGSIEPVEPTLVQPEEVVVGKGKKSKRTFGTSSKHASR